MASLFVYLLRRLLYALSVIIGATFLVFVIFNILVGDPTHILLGKYATPESMALLVRELGLDRPWYIQYWKVLQSAFTFNWATPGRPSNPF